MGWGQAAAAQLGRGGPGAGCAPHRPPPPPLPRPAAGARRPPPPFLTVPLPAWLTSPGGRSYFDMAGPEISPDEQLVAYGVDTEGSEVYTL